MVFHTSVGPAVAALATKHGKERVIAPLVEPALGVSLVVPAGLDTDSYGTFTREVERAGTSLQAARAKARAALDALPEAAVGLASEGSFGPHPQLPFRACDRELVLLLDRESGLELAGHHVTADTNYDHAIVPDEEAALAFARRAGFPAHGVVVIGQEGARPVPAVFLEKDIPDEATLLAAVRDCLARHRSAWLETDMRAHRNPLRMAAIGQATRDLLRRHASRCPRCSAPGFDLAERVTGLPCADCGAPTWLALREVWRCPACAHREERDAGGAAVAEPANCAACNP